MNFNFEYLKHGKALCGKAFKRFVETFNFHNDFIANLKGDADITSEFGHVNVDTTDPSHPVIRCAGCKGSSGGGGSSYVPAPSPFQFTLVTPEPEEGEEEEPTAIAAIVNNTFYWDGVIKSLSDFTPPATCTVYLCCTQDAPSPSGPAPNWSFELSTSPAEETESGRVLNFKLYEIENNAVTMDYRTTFLSISSYPQETPLFVVHEPGGAYDTEQNIVLDSRNDEAATVEVNSNKNLLKYIQGEARTTYSRQTVSTGANTNVITEASTVAGSSVSIKHQSKEIKLSTAHLDASRPSIQFHTLTVKDADGNEDKYTVLADSDIEIFKAKGTVLKDVELKYENYELQMKKTTIDLETGEETEGDYETVFETEMHSAQ